MKQWNEIGIYQVRDILSRDGEYEKLMNQCNKARERYDAIVAKLTAQEREEIEDYIALCEELDYQWTHTAYRCGLMENKKRCQ